MSAGSESPGTAEASVSRAVDPVTGFLSREGFREALEEMVDRAERTGRQVGLIAFDLDSFRSLNDTHGPDAGDDYLRRLGAMLREHLDGSLLGRLGGDEFAVARLGVSVKETIDGAEHIRKLLAEFAPLHDERPLQLTASVGVAVHPDHAGRALDLLLAADGAMRDAKEKGRGWVVLHDPKRRDPEKALALGYQADKIRWALARGFFVPVYQPIADTRTGKVVAVETLARIREEDGALISPTNFLEAAERFGLVTAIDRSIIAAAFDQLSQARRLLPSSFEMSLNLSGLDFEDDSLVAEISRLARARGIRPERITFEITETAALRDLGRVKKFTEALASEGFRFSLDDFGLGFSSFRYLRELPMSTLKFDRSYVETILSSGENLAFVKGVAEICRGLGVKTVAEGVEEPMVFSLLRTLGIDRVQGYHIGRPSPDFPSFPDAERVPSGPIS